ncbi:MAG: hypothetical protein Q4F23_02575 [Coriobacteriia bacterium]|nr:hypothetical protein [Coriobacteriia bacterium]
MSFLSSHKRAIAGLVAAFIAIVLITGAPLCLNAPNKNGANKQAASSAATSDITPGLNTADAAKAKSKGLKVDKTYSLDLDGNKKKEKLIIKRLSYSKEDSAYNKIGVYVNGKLCWSKSASTNFYTSVTARLVTLRNKKSFLWVKATGPDGVCFANSLLSYKSKKIKTAYDLRVPSKYDYGVDRGSSFAGVSGNTIKMKHWFMSATTGVSSFTYSYKYSKGKLKRTSSEAPVSYNAYADGTKYTGSSTWLRCESALKASTTPGGKKKAYTIGAKSPFKVTKIKISGTKVYYQVSNGKKSAWISGLTRYTVYNARYR